MSPNTSAWLPAFTLALPKVSSRASNLEGRSCLLSSCLRRGAEVLAGACQHPHDVLKNIRQGDLLARSRIVVWDWDWVKEIPCVLNLALHHFIPWLWLWTSNLQYWSLNIPFCYSFFDCCSTEEPASRDQEPVVWGIVLTKNKTAPPAPKKQWNDGGCKTGFPLLQRHTGFRASRAFTCSFSSPAAAVVSLKLPLTFPRTYIT